MSGPAARPGGRSRTRPGGLSRTLRYLRPHLAPQGWLLAGGTAALLAQIVFRILEPWPLKWVIDTVVRAQQGPPVAGAGRLLLLAGLATVAVTALRAGTAYLSTVAFALAGSRAMTAVRHDVYAQLMRLSQRFHAGSRTGDLVTRLVSDVGRLQDVAITAALPLAANVLTLFGMAGVMLLLDWRLALVVLLVLPWFLRAGSRSSRRIHAAARQQRRREGALAGVAGESLGALSVVQAYTLEPVMLDRFARSNRGSLREGVRAVRLSAGLERRTDLVIGLGTAAVLVLGGLRVLAGALTPGELVVFLAYLKSAFKPMRDVAKYTGRLAKAAASGERLLDVLAAVPDIADRPGARPAPRFRGDVRFVGVHVSHGRDLPALRGVDLDVPAGTRVGVLGPSGSGKSTLGALLPRLVDPDRGAVLIDGVDLRTWTLASVRAQVAVVLQESVLFAASVRENIGYGRPGATDAQIEAAARAANAHDFITALAHGYDTVLGERGATLSGGERQRLAIARALLRDAPIVVLDEPTASLDDANRQAVQAALRRLTAGRTTFLISHDPDELADCDVLVWVERGVVAPTFGPRQPVREGLGARTG